MSETWNMLLAGIRAGDPLVHAGLAALAALLTYVLVRRLMRVGWLRIAMRIAFFGGVAALIGLAALSLSYYQWQAWLPLGGSMLSVMFSLPATWVLAAGIVAAGLALRRPVRPRDAILVEGPRLPVFEEPPVNEPAVGELQTDNVVEGPWRKAA